jgi:hypothetical protein
MNYLRVGRAVEFSSFNDTPERSEVNLRGDECSSPNEEVRGDGEGHGVALAGAQTFGISNDGAKERN